MYKKNSQIKNNLLHDDGIHYSSHYNIFMDMSFDTNGKHISFNKRLFLNINIKSFACFLSLFHMWNKQLPLLSITRWRSWRLINRSITAFSIFCLFAHWLCSCKFMLLRWSSQQQQQQQQQHKKRIMLGDTVLK